ncbi:MAG: Hsp20/alpha crystallin family protein [Crocinitomicaceae bacterium]|nr:Hsp20/alpha crystallin family protein [Crocinitomicaceae bacterium]
MLVQKRKAEFPVWGDVFGNIFNNDWVNMPTNLKEQFGSFPAVNVKETDADFQIEMAAPGKQKEDFKIDVNENMLTISSEKTNSKEEVEDKYTRKEFSYQSFKRSFKLPEIADSDNTTATYTDGILKISIPKKDTKKHGVKTIAIS